LEKDERENWRERELKFIKGEMKGAETKEKYLLFTLELYEQAHS
jgi:hypothetical protein